MSEKNEQDCKPSPLLSYYIRQDEWVPTVPRGPIGAMYSTPGPAIVALPPTIGEVNHDKTRHKAPAYKIGIRFAQKLTDTGPGPGAYDIRGWTNQGYDRCPAPFIGIRTEPLSKVRTPGPADYSPELCDDAVYSRAPKFTMRIKGKDSKRFQTPAPNAYTLPGVTGVYSTPYPNRAPAYTMGLKLEGCMKAQKGPGPAEYMLPSTNLYRTAPPAYSVPKAKKPTPYAFGPGPQNYHAEWVTFDKHSAPKCTFGIRHTPYKAFPGFAAEK